MAQRQNGYRLTEAQKRKLMQKAKSSYKKADRRTKHIMIAALVIVLVIVGVLYAIKLKNSALFADDRITVSYIDVGQGDSEFICGDGASMLIDCGESEASEQVISYLQELGVKKIDYLICTHPHSDHMGGMYKILDAFEVGEAIIPHLDDSDVPTTAFFEKFLDGIEKHNIKLTEAKLGRVLEIGDARAEIIAPIGRDYDNLNNYSVGIMLRHGKNSFLFTGDAELKAEREMAQSGSLSHVTVYKAGHHGSSTAIQSDFMNIISPDYTVISCGNGNSYGHPHKETLDLLKKLGSKVFRTDRMGTVVFESDGDTLKITTERK